MKLAKRTQLDKLVGVGEIGSTTIFWRHSKNEARPFQNHAFYTARLGTSEQQTFFFFSSQLSPHEEKTTLTYSTVLPSCPTSSPSSTTFPLHLNNYNSFQKM